MDNFIIIHPEFDELRTEVVEIRAEIATLVLERDHLLLQECKNIEMKYMLSIGALEYRAFEIECAVRRLKRTMELIQAKKNRQENFDLAQIEDLLDIEFAAYQERLAQQLAEMTTALERNKGQEMSESEAHELRQLYHSVVKELHPDLHPDLTEEKLHLFHLAVDAYGRGDLHGLRAIATIVVNPVAPDRKLEGFGFLVREMERLTETRNQLRRSIDVIKTSFPYTMKAIVDSAEKTKTRQSELNERIESLNEILSAYHLRIEELMRYCNE